MALQCKKLHWERYRKHGCLPVFGEEQKVVFPSSVYSERFSSVKNRLHTYPKLDPESGIACCSKVRTVSGLECGAIVSEMLLWLESYALVGSLQRNTKSPKYIKQRARA